MLNMRRLFTLFVAIVLLAAPLCAQKKDTYRVRTVVIDPGHGGAKPGAKGSRSYEKDITLSIALKFGKLLKDNYPDLKVIYTRTKDVDISLAERAHIANRNKADLFISIHANSHPTSAPTGVETFVMGLSESRANLEVAKTENADILLESDYKSNEAYRGFDPNAPESFVMLAMFQNAFIDKSLNLAQAIQNQYKHNLRTINRGVKQAELFVLYKTTCPSVLTEVGFISNPAEEAFMLSDEGQAKIAVSLFNAFMTFKATEEGSDRIANPKIDLPGYQAKPKEEPKPAPAPAPKEEPKPEPKPKEEPKPAPAPVPAPAVATVQDSASLTSPTSPTSSTSSTKDSSSAPEPVLAEVPSPAPKPVPTATLPTAPAPNKVNPAPAPVPKVEPAPAPKVEPAPAPTPAPEPEPTPEPEPAKPTLVPPVNTAPADAKQYYTVQFLTTHHLFDEGHHALDGVTGVERTHKDKYYAYSTGRFATFQEASDYSQHLKATTRFKDAWARLHKPDETKDTSSTSPTSASSASSSTSPTSATSSASSTPHSSQTTYRIQFCTATREMKAGDPDLHGITDFRFSKSGQYYIYTTGDYATHAEANRALAELKRKTPFKDAFVFAFRDGKRIHQYLPHQ